MCVCVACEVFLQKLNITLWFTIHAAEASLKAAEEEEGPNEEGGVDILGGSKHDKLHSKAKRPRSGDHCAVYLEQQSSRAHV